MSTMGEGRETGTDRRRQRVIKAIKDAAEGGSPISVSGRRPWTALSSTATATCAPWSTPPSSNRPVRTRRELPPVSRASLQADLANAQARNTRLVAHMKQLEKRLAEALGEQVWRESGLGAPAGIDELQRKIVQLEQQNVNLRASLEEREAELRAAREANRQLTRALNQRE